MPREDGPSVAALAVSLSLREGISCAGVDIQVAAAAPFGECGWINYNAYDDLALGAVAAFGFLNDLLPTLEGIGKGVGVRHDLQDSRIVLFQIPANPKDVDVFKGVGHGGSSAIDSLPTTIADEVA